MAIGIIFLFQAFNTYLVRTWQCYLSVTCGYSFSYSILSSSYLFVTVPYWNFKLNLVDYLWPVSYRRGANSSNTYIDDVNLSKDTSLTHFLNNEGINNDDEDLIIIKHSSYHTVADLENIKLAQGSINIMSLNCQSINAKFNELQIIVEEINNNPLSGLHS